MDKCPFCCSLDCSEIKAGKFNCDPERPRYNVLVMTCLQCRREWQKPVMTPVIEALWEGEDIPG